MMEMLDATLQFFLSFKETERQPWWTALMFLTPHGQIRVGAANENRGKAFVIYEDIYDAKDALEHLNGFNVCGRYLVVLYFHPEKEQKRMNLEKQRKEVEELRKMVDAGRKGT